MVISNSAFWIWLDLWSDTSWSQATSDCSFVTLFHEKSHQIQRHLLSLSQRTPAWQHPKIFPQCTLEPKILLSFSVMALCSLYLPLYLHHHSSLQTLADLLLLMCLKKWIITHLIPFSSCSNSSFWPVLLHLKCQSLQSFLFSSFGLGAGLLKGMPLCL